LQAESASRRSTVRRWRCTVGAQIFASFTAVECAQCGLCAVDVLEAEAAIDHRDVFLSPEERAEGTRMCACVSRFAGGRARIDIGYRP
jgi:MinD superfamily P-loop ATPase